MLGRQQFCGGQSNAGTGSRNHDSFHSLKITKIQTAAKIALDATDEFHDFIISKLEINCVALPNLGKLLILALSLCALPSFRIHMVFMNRNWIRICTK
jgi:hypothetical protein